MAIQSISLPIICSIFCFFFFFSSRRRHTRWPRDWSSDVCSSDLEHVKPAVVFIKSERRERVTNRRLPPGFEDFFQLPRRPHIEQGSGSGISGSQDGRIPTQNHVVEGADRVSVRLVANREFSRK